MSAATSNRAPLVLLLVVVLGLATRAVRDRAGEPDPTSSFIALDSQLSRVAATSSGAKSGAARSRRSVRSKGSESSASAKKGRAASRGGEAASVAGAVIRSERTPFGALPPEVLQARARDSARAAAASIAKRATVASTRPARRSPSSQPPPVSRAAPLDLDSAPAEEIERLPRIGPALARRIVEDRQAHGAFGSLSGLQRVRGIGPATAALIRGRVTFTGARRP